MTALIYKPTFPIPTQGDAGEVLVLNDAGTAYELEPAQGGAYVAGTDWLDVPTDYNATQTFTPGVTWALTTLTLDPGASAGSSFTVGTKGIQVVDALRVQGVLYLDVASGPAADAQLEMILFQLATDGGALAGLGRSFSPPPLAVLAGTTPYLEIPFALPVAQPGAWFCLVAKAKGSAIALDDFGGMFIERTL